MEKRGLFIDFEGIDGAGKTSQIELLGKAICSANKYQDILRTREPTWRADEIKKSLIRDKDAFTDGEKLARLFVEDRKVHTYEQIQRILMINAYFVQNSLSAQFCFCMI